MARSGEGTVRIVADDLTGALDAAAPLVPMVGQLAVVWDLPSSEKSGGSFVLDSETRDAKELRTDWIDAFRGAGLAFKKIDSLLRGRTVDEIAVCLASGLFESALIAPAFPAQERITRDGRQYWRARPCDDWHPVGCDLIAELRRRRVPIHQASSSEEVVGHGLFLCDAATEQDLRAIVDVGQRLAPPLLWIGTAGLARALAGSREETMPEPLPAPLLLVIGSHHPVTLAQVEQLAARAPDATVAVRLDSDDLAPALDALAAALATRGRAVLLFELPDGTGADVAGPLFDRVMDLVIRQLPPPGSLVVTGGATLFRLVRRLGADSLLVSGEVMPGVARSQLQGGRWPGATVISKSGAFGAPNLLVRWWNLVQP